MVMRVMQNRSRNIYLSFHRGRKFEYFVRLHEGRVEVVKLKLAKADELIPATGPQTDVKHCVDVFLASHLPKTERAVRVLQAIKDGKSPTLSALETSPKAKVINGEKLVDLKLICRELDLDPRAARKILRDKKIARTQGRWAFPQSDIERIKSLLK
ncbi:MAG: hypothetical protein QXL34_07250 [Thermosphaera sp.]